MERHSTESKNILVPVFVAMTLLFLALPAEAQIQWQTHGGAQVRFSHPQTWQARPNGNIMTIAAPGGGVAVDIAGITNGAQAVQAEAQVLQVLGTRFRNVQVRGRRPVAQHGMSGQQIFGACVGANGQPVEWMAFYLRHPNNRTGVIAIGFALPGYRQAHWPALSQILNSIQPA